MAETHARTHTLTQNQPLATFLLCGDNSTMRSDVRSNGPRRSHGFQGLSFGDAAADEALRRVFVNAPLTVSVPAAECSLQMTTLIHQSQLRSTLGIPSSTSFQCYLSLLRPLLFFLAKELSFYCKYSPRLSAPFRVRVALRQGSL